MLFFDFFLFFLSHLQFSLGSSADLFVFIQLACQLTHLESKLIDLVFVLLLFRQVFSFVTLIELLSLLELSQKWINIFVLYLYRASEVVFLVVRERRQQGCRNFVSHVYQKNILKCRLLSLIKNFMITPTVRTGAHSKISETVEDSPQQLSWASQG